MEISEEFLVESAEKVLSQYRKSVEETSVLPAAALAGYIGGGFGVLAALAFSWSAGVVFALGALGIGVGVFVQRGFAGLRMERQYASLLRSRERIVQVLDATDKDADPQFVVKLQETLLAIDEGIKQATLAYLKRQKLVFKSKAPHQVADSEDSWMDEVRHAARSTEMPVPVPTHVPAPVHVAAPTHVQVPEDEPERATVTA